MALYSEDAMIYDIMSIIDSELSSKVFVPSSAQRNDEVKILELECCSGIPVQKSHLYLG